MRAIFEVMGVSDVVAKSFGQQILTIWFEPL